MNQRKQIKKKMGKQPTGMQEKAWYDGAAIALQYCAERFEVDKNNLIEKFSEYLHVKLIDLAREKAKEKTDESK